MTSHLKVGAGQYGPTSQGLWPVTPPQNKQILILQRPKDYVLQPDELPDFCSRVLRDTVWGQDLYQDLMSQFNTLKKQKGVVFYDDLRWKLPGPGTDFHMKYFSFTFQHFVYTEYLKHYFPFILFKGDNLSDHECLVIDYDLFKYQYYPGGDHNGNLESFLHDLDQINKLVKGVLHSSTSTPEAEVGLESVEWKAWKVSSEFQELACAVVRESEWFVEHAWSGLSDVQRKRLMEGLYGDPQTEDGMFFDRFELESYLGHNHD